MHLHCTVKLDWILCRGLYRMFDKWRTALASALFTVTCARCASLFFFLLFSV